MANGAIISYSGWHVRAVARLDSKRAEDLFQELLYEPEYERDAAAALVRLARPQNPYAERRLPFKALDYQIVRDARSGRRATEFDEQCADRYARAIKQRIFAIAEERSRSDNPDSFNGRLKTLATSVAALDGRNSADFVIGIMALPGEWDGWERVTALEALLFSGAYLSAQAVLSVLNPTIDNTLAHSNYDQQERYLLGRCLCVLTFIDEPSIGIGRMREILRTAQLRGYELQQLMTELGHSRCDDALGLLLDLGRTSAKALQGAGAEWIDAIATLHTTESKQVLLSFADPDLPDFGVHHHLEHHEFERLAARIADIARAEPAVRDRLYLLCAHELPSGRRLLLGRIIAQLGTRDAMIAGLSLIRDNGNPPIPFELMRSLEDVFLERRPYGETGSAYMLEPRDATEIRSRLLEMVMNDNNRKRATWSLLGQIELWRLEYGRPANEPRHPAFDSGVPWPPIGLAGAT